MRQFAQTPRAAAALLILSAAFAVCAVELAFTLGPRLDHFVDYWLYDAVMIAAGLVIAGRARGRQGERLAWLLAGVAVTLWGVGDAIWTFAYVDLADPPFPSIADAFWLAIYPPLYVALILLVRAHSGVVRRSLWLDGVIGGLSVAALGTAVVFQEVLHATGGSPAATATNLTYPLADLTLVGLVVWVLGASGWRPGRAWGLLLGGLLVFSVSDCLYLFQTAVGSYQAGGLTDLGWLAGGVLLAWAAWQPRGRERIGRDLDGHWVLLAPVGYGLLALGLLVYDHFDRVDVLSLGLAILAIVGLHARLALTFAENLHMLRRTSTEARTDALTGLGNRRQLMLDLDRVFENSEGGVLVLFDLNGFKLYNDHFGHPAGDTLLTQLGRQLRDFAHDRGTPYRMGGDEFCLLVRRPHLSGDTVAAAGAQALAAQGEGFSISAAYGCVELDSETRSAAAALRLADQRMYSQKHAARGSAGDQSMNVLLRAQGERDPHLAAHLRGVAALAEAVAIRLGLPAAEVRHARLGAMLHDVGKIAIPDAILEKRSPLTDNEWRFLQSHTVIGERILAAAPALSAIAPIVRSSHERFDGGGYPDGLAGEQIPVAARIVFVCDAFDAMTAERPYAPAMPVEEALAELWRCSGSKFDPKIVAAFCAVVESRDAQPAAVALAS